MMTMLANDKENDYDYYNDDNNNFTPLPSFLQDLDLDHRDLQQSTPPQLWNGFGNYCPNVGNFQYEGTGCDPGYWCGCADPTGRRCAPSNDLQTTAWVGRYTTGEGTRFEMTMLGWSIAFPPDYFKCNSTLYCPGENDAYVCPQLCQAGFYCPNTTVQIPCPENHYCLMGSTKPTPCKAGIQYCPPNSTIYESSKACGWIMGLSAILLGCLYLANYLLASVEAIEDHEDNCKSYRKLLPLPKKEIALSMRQSTMSIHGPNDKIDIAFQDLQLTLPNGLCIMEGVSGELKSGKFCAILGPSGAGKTTFLNLIAGKNDPTGGKLLLNGKEGRSLTEYRRLVGYVPQEDIMLRELTVYENIRHAAMMRLPATTSKAKKLKRVEQVMESLDLVHVKDSIIGDELKRGISGGQRKRVNVAMELVMDPALICLDEPTSGLDSTSSSMLCESLLALSRLGVNVSAVLHQPKTEIFDMFDTVLLLGVGGRTVYLGPAEEMVDYFTRIGFPLPPRTNPADYYMDVVAGLIPCEGEPAFVKEDLFDLWEEAIENPDCEKNGDGEGGEDLNKHLDEEPLGKEPQLSLTTEKIEESIKYMDKLARSKLDVYRRHVVALCKHIFNSGNPEVREIPGFFGQTYLLYRRAVLQRIRAPANTFWPILLAIFAGAVTGGVAAAMGTDPTDSLQPMYYGISWPRLEKEKASFRFLANYPIPPANNVVQLWQITGLVILLVSVLGINVFGRERAVFFRDAAGGTLVSSYWIAKTLECFLWLPLYAAVFSSTNYAIQSLVMPLVDYWLIAWMCFIGFYGIGGCSSILIGLENRGIVTLVTGLLCLLLFTGFLFPFDGKWYFKPFFTFWVAQAFNSRMSEFYNDAFDTQAMNKDGAGYNLENSFNFNISMAFVTGFAWHLVTLFLLKVVDFRKQR